MNDNLRIKSKQIALDIFKKNALNLILVAMIALLIPAAVFLVGYIFIYIAVIVGVIVAQDNQVLTTFFAIMMAVSMILLMVICAASSLPFFAKLSSIHSNLLRGNSFKVSDIFENVKNKEKFIFSLKVGGRFALYGLIVSIPLIIIQFALPMLSVFAINIGIHSGIAFVFLMLSALIGIVLLVATLPLYRMLYFVYNLTIMHENDDSFDAKQVTKMMLYHLKKEYITILMFDLSFLGWNLLASALSSIAFGASIGAFVTYNQLTSIIYAQTIYDKIKNEQRGF